MQVAQVGSKSQWYFYLHFEIFVDSAQKWMLMDKESEWWGVQTANAPIVFLSVDVLKVVFFIKNMLQV